MLFFIVSFYTNTVLIFDFSALEGSVPVAPSTSAAPTESVVTSTARSGSLIKEDDDDLDLDLEGVHLDETIDTTVSGNLKN